MFKHLKKAAYLVDLMLQDNQISKKRICQYDKDNVVELNSPVTILDLLTDMPGAGHSNLSNRGYHWGETRIHAIYARGNNQG
ncbi:hypothetical protein BMS3Bbin11_01400 [bacterium BMS3Bbin11]|nr:hypothetical protein BMS3Abin11_01319 [bacterium BMS3Abin11]GBE46300.1 hypothetical protein BMS3Bbin11_01400 [bacterium BMS3Bbin11]GMT41318.1 MAG: hypothetical protein IEMM0001_2053 [bacterium]HDZ79326.1 hypothetical protein [Gammaproteobacteria bacterium]